jgi:hypothetical protein
MLPSLPKPVKSDLRFSWRVDYFATPQDAVTFFENVREEGYNAHSPNDAAESGPYAGLYGVHWQDRPGGWYA